MALYLCSGVSKKRMMYNLYVNQSIPVLLLGSWSASTTKSVDIPFNRIDEDTGKEIWITTLQYYLHVGLKAGMGGTVSTKSKVYAIDKNGDIIGTIYSADCSTNESSGSGQASKNAACSFIDLAVPEYTDSFRLTISFSGANINPTTSYVKNVYGYYKIV